ncbi:MAG: hypothetical protein ACU0CA_06120 [Paracoccaceae bacterium]
MAKNKFLIEFVNHEYVNVLSVIVTVSLVSVTQIHLEYSRIERRFRQRVFQDARRTVNIGALLLTGMLLLAFVISFIRAEVSDNNTSLSLVHGAALLTIVTAVFIMYDLVRVVYVLAADEPIDENEEPDDGSADG